jgi:adenine-specific DNA methylase
MTFENKPVILTEEATFETVLDTACERLNEKHIQYSLRRIKKLDEVLAGFEKELDDFLSAAP